MNEIKIFIAVALAIAVVQAHASSDELSKSRQTSAERRVRLNSEEHKELQKLLKSQSDLSDAVRALQNGPVNQFLNTIKPDQRDGNLRYKSTNELLAVLANQRKALDSQEVINPNDLVKIAQNIYSGLTGYSNDEGKVTFIVKSQEFKNLKRRL